MANEHRHLFSFEKLVAWQKSKNLLLTIYALTEKFPKEEKFNLVDQMRRAALSTLSNLAEGSSRSTPTDKARYVQIAFGSLIELMSHIIISKELGYLKDAQETELRIGVKELSAILTALKKSQLHS